MFSTYFRPGDRVRSIIDAQGLRFGREYTVTGLRRQPFGIVLYELDSELVVANGHLLLSRVEEG